jgi:hypothetical protein
MMLLSINLVDPLFLSQFDAHAQFGSLEMLILRLALIETLGDTGVSQLRHRRSCEKKHLQKARTGTMSKLPIRGLRSVFLDAPT